MQKIITYTIVIIAVVFLVKKYFFKTKNNSKCDTNCGCS